MFTKTILAAAALAVVMAGPASAGWGYGTSGPVLNGISLNGISLNGPVFQGPGLNVGGHQGVGLNGQVIAIEF